MKAFRKLIIKYTPKLNQKPRKKPEKNGLNSVEAQIVPPKGDLVLLKRQDLPIWPCLAISELETTPLPDSVKCPSSDHVIVWILAENN